MHSRIAILILSLFLVFGTGFTLLAQNVGVGTSTPQGPFHVASSGQVNFPGGLVILGDTSEGHMQLDFNIVQSFYDNTPLELQLQPEGGNVRIGVNLFHANTSNGFVGIGTISAEQKLHLYGSGDQFLRVQTSSAGSSQAGLDLIRSSEFSGSDWRVVNNGGILEFRDETDNFMTDGDLNMVLTQGGNLGLGTDAPASHLHVAGTTDQFITVHRTTLGAGMAGIDLLRSSEFNSTDWRIVNDGGILKFYDGTDNFSTEGDLNVVMTQGGNVGIGTSSPGAPLHVLGTSFVGETGSGFLQVGTPGGSHLRFDNNEILARNGDSPSRLYLQYWSGDLSLCDDNSGRVGIGTTSPQAKVHITDGGDVNLGGGGELVLGATSGANVGMDGNEIQARNNGSSSHLFLQASGGDVLMVPNETGQVGIGITSSANMPSDDYLLAVDGKIISEEVRVEISGSWPDYVFAEDYALMPLEAVEQHIVMHNHLPGMPSAETVANEGIELGDMQRAMMEKIEELTLYVIQLRKEIELLKAR